MIVWTNKDITPSDQVRRRGAPQTIAFKDYDGITTVLEELHLHAMPRSDGSADLAAWSNTSWTEL